MPTTAKNLTQSSRASGKLAKDKNPASKPIGVAKPRLGFARNWAWIAENAFDEDLRP
ncbi:MAG: hypothetical protein MUE30_01100 [Spirosomaceae bacterium]|jgi:hypothetical protein|nr:hypothetical protein [Spirosomataceae bacterium]